MILFVTPRSTASGHCQDEVSYALDRDIPVVAVHLEDTELPPGPSLRLSKKQAILVEDMGYDAYLGKLMRGLSEHLKITDAGARVPAASGTTRGFSGKRWLGMILAAIVSVVLMAGVGL